MGLFDSIAGNVLGSILGGNQQGGGALGSLLGAVMSGANQQEASGAIGNIINAAGGINGLHEKAKSMGIGDIVGSWIGKGDNQPISGDQVTQLLGSENIQAIASKFGVNLQQLTPLIAGMLPVIVDKLTPHGQATPDQHSGDALQTAVSGLLSGGGFASILGSVLSGKPA